MKKKLFCIVLSMCFAVSCMFMLTACGGQAHTHTYEDGKCTACGYIEETDLDLEYTDDTYTAWRVAKDPNRKFSSLKYIRIPAQWGGKPVVEIGKDAFWQYSAIAIVIPDSVTKISDDAFNRCVNLTTVVLPEDVTSIGQNVFFGCTSLTTVYFAGTAEDWVEVTIGSGNYCLTGDAIYYYSASQPTGSGNYWHYEQDGKTPTKW